MGQVGQGREDGGVSGMRMTKSEAASLRFSIDSWLGRRNGPTEERILSLLARGLAAEEAERAGVVWPEWPHPASERATRERERKTP